MRLKITSRASLLGVALLTALAMVHVPHGLADDLAEEAAFQADGHPFDDPEEFGLHDGHNHGFVEDGLAAAAGSGMIANFFNESYGCDGPAGAATPMSTTNSSSGRSLPSGHQVRGPWGDFFGRDYSDVYGSLVAWEVPMSGGRIVKVHERALPAFQLVTENLAAAAAEGKNYTARMASAFVWRRIGGSYRMSTHSFGTTIDINWDRNPYRGDNALVTDMPAWYVQAWTDAGFCWGGDWVNIKDPMHFSWKGPLATPGYGAVGAPYPAKTAADDYDRLAFAGESAFGPIEAGETLAVLDGNRDSSPDLWRTRPSGAADLVVSYARSSRDFGRCGVSEAVVPGAAGAPGEVILADFDGDSRPDVVVVDDTGPTLRLRVQSYADDYLTATNHQTGAPSASGSTYGFADYDRDGRQDLYVISRKDNTRVRVWDAASGFTTQLVDATTALPSTAGQAKWRLSLVDWDVDGVPDLVASRINDNVQLRVVFGADGYTGPVEVRSTAATADRDGEYGFGDYDGDGRPDLFVVDSSGEMEIWLGGVQPGSLDFWFRQPSWTCDGIGTLVPWDLNGDRIADLTIGAPGEDVAGLTDAGQVHVLYGDVEGPSADGDQIWHQDTPDVAGPAEVGDHFGASLVSGDFDGDGYGDLAVAAPDDGVGAMARAGVVNVIYGSRNGLNGNRTQMWHKDVAGLAGAAATDAGFGTALAAGDFNGDGRGDLVIGAPGENGAAGALSALYGSRGGLTTAASDHFRMGTDGIGGSSLPDAGFGAALATGDFNDDGYDDVAVGAPGYEVRGLRNAGTVVVILGSAEGLVTAGHQVIDQRGAVWGVPHAGDRFGEAVEAGDFDGDGFADLVIGVPGEMRRGFARAGLVTVLFGSADSVTAAGQQRWAQSSPGVPGAAEKNDRFGAALSVGDYDDDGFADLAIGSPNEGINGLKKAGSVTVLRGGLAGLDADGALQLVAGVAGLVGASERDDRLGSTLVSADFNGDDHDDLAIGIPGEDQGVPDTGSVVVVQGGAGGLSPGMSELWHQDVPGVEGSGEAGDLMGVVR